MPSSDVSGRKLEGGDQVTKSIISNEYECIICGQTEHLHRHH